MASEQAERKGIPSAFELVRNGVGKQIQEHKDHEKKTIETVRMQIGILASNLQERLPSLILVAADVDKKPTQGYFGLTEYSPLENSLYISVRHSYSLANREVFEKESQALLSPGESRESQSIQHRARLNNDDPRWLEYATKIIDGMQEAAQQDEFIPMIAVTVKREEFKFPLIPLPQDDIHHIYFEEIEAMKAKGGQIGERYSQKKKISLTAS